VTIRISVNEVDKGDRHNLKALFLRQVYPAQGARTFDSIVVPSAVIQDYQEACLIEELSPKAAATLCRRAMQGILRHFYSATGKDLYHQISSVEDRCEAALWGAMDALRKVGNIGAHMERDIDVIVDVDPGEAKALRQLIELMIDETYIARHAREQKIRAVMLVAENKEIQRKKSTEEHTDET